MAEKHSSTPQTGGTLGTFAGVFTPSVLTILGIILFLRMGFVVGNAGLLKTMLILAIATSISVLTSLSLSAIATNMRVKGGGDYFLISRTLGVSFGGALGIVLFLAQSVSIAFYAIGFGEAMTSIFGLGWAYWPQVIAALAAIGIFGMAWLGADWASRFQYVVMGFLVAALLSFFIGAFAKLDGGHFAKNLTSPAKSLPFWAIFAIFFPAVTGFTQGVSMSGDLRDPGKSLPYGTFAAVGISTVVYFLVAILFAATLPAQTMILKSDSMNQVAWIGWLISFGVVAATLSSAMASFLGAPRILQALAADKIFSFLNPFAKGEGPSNNPRRGVLLSGAIAMITIMLGNLNVIAPVVSMFFLISYGLLNYATYYEADAASPSFRPRFKWFDKRLSLLGALACIGVMLAISPTAGGISLVVLFALYQYLQRSHSIVRWADSQHAHHYKRAREHLWSMAHDLGHPRDWRPQTLVFAEDAPRREVLLQFASWMEGGSGLTMAVSILEGSGAALRKQRNDMINELKKEIATAGVVAYPLVVVAPEKRAATALIMQTAGIGPLRANTSLFNWLEDPSEPSAAAMPPASDEERMMRFSQMLRNQVRYGANVCLLKADELDWKKLLSQDPEERRIDVWWWDTASCRLMLLIAYLFTRTDEWLGASLRVLAPVAKDQDAATTLTNLQQILDDARIEAEPIVIEHVDTSVVTDYSHDASIVLLPLRIRQNLLNCPIDVPIEQLLKQLPVVGLVLAAGEVSLDADPDSGPLQVLNAARDQADEAEHRAEKAEKTVEEARSIVEQLLQKKEKMAAKEATLSPEQREAFDLELKALEGDIEHAKEEADDAFKRAAKARAKATHLSEDADALASSIAPAAKAIEDVKEAAKEAVQLAKEAEATAKEAVADAKEAAKEAVALGEEITSANEGDSKNANQASNDSKASSNSNEGAVEAAQDTNGSSQEDTNETKHQDVTESTKEDTGQKAVASAPASVEEAVVTLREAPTTEEKKS